MTVQAFKKKLSKIGKKNLFIIVSSIIILIGVACFVLAYGLSDGWASVAAWFGSKTAVLLYIFLGCYGLLVLWLVFAERIRKL